MAHRRIDSMESFASAESNEFPAHLTERGNYLGLGCSKLRPAAIGPELMTGEVLPDIRGTSRILLAPPLKPAAAQPAGDRPCNQCRHKSVVMP
jgi:hypothetical protein